MAVCDISGSFFESNEGYVLITSEVVTNPSYWEYGLTNQWDFMHKIDLEGESFVRVIKKKRNQNSTWHIGEKVIHLFDLERVKMYARKHVLTRDDSTPPNMKTVADAAITAWKKLYGNSPRIKVVESPKRGFYEALLQAASEGNTSTIKALLYQELEQNTVLMGEAELSYVIVVEILLKYEAEGNVATTALEFAAERGHVEIIELLLNHKLWMDVAKDYDFTALRRAAEHGHVDVVKLLLEQGAEINASKTYGFTSLMGAAKHGHSDVIELLLEHGLEINAASNNGWTSLMYAAMYGHVDAVRLLLEHGAEVHTVNKDGWTALMYASTYGVDVVKLLLERGAEINAISKNGWTAIRGAVECGHVDVVTLLLESGAKANNSGENSWVALLRGAADNGHVEVVKFLLEHGPVLNATYDSTVVMGAVKHGHIEVIELLLEGGIKINKSIDKDWLAFNLSAIHGHVKVAKLLLQKGVVNAADDIGSKILIDLSGVGNVDVVKLLFQYGAKVNDAVDLYLDTALIKASVNGHAEVVKVLISNGAYVNAYGGFHVWTALSGAANHGHTDVVELLLQYGADINAAAKDDLPGKPVDDSGLEYYVCGGKTPLMFATEEGHTDVVKLLLQYGADVNAVSYANQTALGIAFDKHHTDIIKLLQTIKPDREKMRLVKRGKLKISTKTSTWRSLCNFFEEMLGGNKNK